MIIKLPVLYEGALGEKHLITLFDSGATFSCINPEYVEDLANKERLFRPLRVATAASGTYMEIESCVRLDFYINDVRMSDEFMVIPNLSEEAIIGVTSMQKWRMKLDFDKDTVEIDPKVAKAILKQLK